MLFKEKLVTIQKLILKFKEKLAANQNLILKNYKLKKLKAKIYLKSKTYFYHK